MIPGDAWYTLPFSFVVWERVPFLKCNGIGYTVHKVGHVLTRTFLINILVNRLKLAHTDLGTCSNSIYSTTSQYPILSNRWITNKWETCWYKSFDILSLFDHFGYHSKTPTTTPPPHPHMSVYTRTFIHTLINIYTHMLTRTYWSSWYTVTCYHMSVNKIIKCWKNFSGHRVWLRLI